MPYGRCELCGKPIWSRRERRSIPGGGVRHVDCLPGGSSGQRYHVGHKQGWNWDETEERWVDPTRPEV